MPLDKQWSSDIGKARERCETVNRKDLVGLASLLDYPVSPDCGDLELPWPVAAVPPFAHWLNGNPQARQSELGPDGHPQKGSFIPDIPYPRRMWAGSRVQLLNDYAVGEKLLHRESIKAIEHKTGRSGDMVFVTLQHDYFLNSKLILQEQQDMVYRAPASSPLPEPQPMKEAEALALHEYDWCRVIHPDPVLLFHYSAVTSNGHRIHYDRDYVTCVENYPGLIVHGPLIATLLIDLYQRNKPQRRISGFEFKSVGPLYDINPFYIMGKRSEAGATMQAVNCCGQVAMKMNLTV